MSKCISGVIPERISEETPHAETHGPITRKTLDKIRRLTSGRIFGGSPHIVPRKPVLRKFSVEFLDESLELLLGESLEHHLEKWLVGIQECLEGKIHGETPG